VDLSILFEDNDGKIPSLLLSQSQELLRQLPLESLILSGVHFKDGCAFLSSAWLEIVRLSCERQSASLAELALFAWNLPDLE
jgi:hypothetical protein